LGMLGRVAEITPQTVAATIMRRIGLPSGNDTETEYHFADFA